MAIEPIFEPQFHDGSYGYRPKRNAQQAVVHATELMRERGLEFVVDMDLSKCFDRLDHDLILKAVRRSITDGSILALIRMFLQSGVMLNGVCSPTEVLEKELKLIVNQRKTHRTNLDDGVAYLSFVIRRNFISIKESKVAGLKEKLKLATRRNTPVNQGNVIRDINPILRGFVNYFKLANCKAVLRSIIGWLRRRLRAIQLKLWKTPAKLHRRLRQLGYKGEFKAIKTASWKNAGCQLAHWAMPNNWFHEMGLYHPPQLVKGPLLLF